MNKLLLLTLISVTTVQNFFGMQTYRDKLNQIKQEKELKEELEKEQKKDSYSFTSISSYRGSMREASKGIIAGGAAYGVGRASFYQAHSQIPGTTYRLLHDILNGTLHYSSFGLGIATTSILAAIAGIYGVNSWQKKVINDPRYYIKPLLHIGIGSGVAGNCAKAITDSVRHSHTLNPYDIAVIGGVGIAGGLLAGCGATKIYYHHK